MQGVVPEGAALKSWASTDTPIRGPSWPGPRARVGGGRAPLWLKNAVAKIDPALLEPLALVHEGSWCRCSAPDRMWGYAADRSASCVRGSWPEEQRRCNADEVWAAPSLGRQRGADRAGQWCGRAMRQGGLGPSRTNRPVRGPAANHLDDYGGTAVL